MVRRDGVLVKDDVWDALLKMGIVKDIQPESTQPLADGAIMKQTGLQDRLASQDGVIKECREGEE